MRTQSSFSDCPLTCHPPRLGEEGKIVRGRVEEGRD